MLPHIALIVSPCGVRWLPLKEKFDVTGSFPLLKKI